MNREEQELVEDAESNPLHTKFSLAHYFTNVFIVFVGLIIAATILLFIWSNTSEGAFVKLTVSLITPVNDDQYASSIHPAFASYFAADSNAYALTQESSANSTTSSSTDIPPRMSFAALNNKEALLNFIIDRLSYLKNTNDHNNNNNTYSLMSAQKLQHITNYDQSDTESVTETKTTVVYAGNIFSFSLVSAVSDFWQSRAWALAILVAAFSGVWPYLKLLLLMVCWLQPMEQPRRLKIIVFLDQLGKFSFIDLFVSMYMIVSFYVTIKEELKQEYGLIVNITVEPVVGLNTFVLGTVISMIYSHLFLYLDNQYAVPHMKQIAKHKQFLEDMAVVSVKQPVQPQPQNQSVFMQNPQNVVTYAPNNMPAATNPEIPPPPHSHASSASQHSSVSPYKYNVQAQAQAPLPLDYEIQIQNQFGKKSFSARSNPSASAANASSLYAMLPGWVLGTKPFAFRSGILPQSRVGIAVHALVLCLAILLIWGTLESCFMSPVRYQIEGLAGWAVPDAIRSYSAWEIVTDVPKCTDRQLAAVLLSVTFFMSILFFPILLSILVCATWFLPTNYELLGMLYHAIQVCMAWSSLDVYLVASFAASTELDRVSKWIIDQNYAAICGKEGIIPLHVGYDCFSVVGTIVEAAYMTMAVVICMYFVVIYTLVKISKVTKIVAETEKKDKSEYILWGAVN